MADHYTTKRLEIDGLECQGCGLCEDACPNAAIIAGDGMTAVWYADDCLSCPTCAAAEECPMGAIREVE